MVNPCFFFICLFLNNQSKNQLLFPFPYKIRIIKIRILEITVNSLNSLQRYRKLVELSPIAIGIHQYGLLTYINPAGLKILGANGVEDVVGKNLLTFILPEYHEIIKERWKLMKQINTHVEPLEEKMMRLDNKVIDIEIMALPIEINGNPHVQIIFQDITERKKVEEMTHRLAYQEKKK